MTRRMVRRCIRTLEVFEADDRGRGKSVEARVGCASAQDLPELRSADPA